MERYDLHIYFGNRELVVSYSNHNEALEILRGLRAGKWHELIDKNNNAIIQINGAAISYMEIKRENRP